MEPKAADKKLLPIISDWRIDETGGRQFGICMVEVPPPQDYLTFKRGFPLTNPGHVRCAIFSLRLALEICLGNEQVPGSTNAAVKNLSGEPVYVRVLRDFFSIIVTRSQIVHDFFCGPRADKNRDWSRDTSKKPISMFGYGKSFISTIFEMIDHIKEKEYGDVTCTPPEEIDESKSILLKHKVNLDVDPEADYEKTDDQKETEKRIDDMRQRQYLRNELMEMIGARSSRMKRKITKKEKRAIVKKDDIKKEKDVKDGVNPETGVTASKTDGVVSKTGVASDAGVASIPGEPLATATKAAAASRKPSIRSAAWGRDFARDTIPRDDSAKTDIIDSTSDAANGAPAAGHVDPAPGDADSHVQISEHGAAGREQPVEN